MTDSLNKHLRVGRYLRSLFILTPIKHWYPFIPIMDRFFSFIWTHKKMENSLFFRQFISLLGNLDGSQGFSIIPENLPFQSSIHWLIWCYLFTYGKRKIMCLPPPLLFSRLKTLLYGKRRIRYFRQGEQHDKRAEQAPCEMSSQHWLQHEIREEW